MQLPLEISYRDVTKTPALEDLVAGKAEDLEKVCDHINSCRVALERPHASVRSGNPYRVRVVVRVPPKHEIVAAREPGQSDPDAPLSAVVSDTFDAARRQLRDLVEKQRGRVKAHPEQQVEGVVVRLFKDRNYGFLKTVDDRDIYFHRNSVPDDWDRMEVGTGVRFTESMGQDGPQATTVQIVDKPGARASEDDDVSPPPGWKPKG